MDNIIALIEDDIFIGYTTSQEKAYTYILNRIHSLAESNPEYKRYRHVSDTEFLVKTYNDYCNGIRDDFGVEFLNIWAERAEEI